MVKDQEQDRQLVELQLYLNKNTYTYILINGYHFELINSSINFIKVHILH